MRRNGELRVQLEEAAAALRAARTERDALAVKLRICEAGYGAWLKDAESWRKEAERLEAERDAAADTLHQARQLAATAANDDLETMDQIQAGDALLDLLTGDRNGELRVQLEEAAAALRAEPVTRTAPPPDVATQALWDVYGALGFDTDGEPTPAALIAGMGVADFCRLVVSAAEEFRRNAEGQWTP
jgi:hypothetical protein